MRTSAKCALSNLLATNRAAASIHRPAPQRTGESGREAILGRLRLHPIRDLLETQPTLPILGWRGLHKGDLHRRVLARPAITGVEQASLLEGGQQMCALGLLGGPFLRSGRDRRSIPKPYPEVLNISGWALRGAAPRRGGVAKKASLRSPGGAFPSNNPTPSPSFRPKAAAQSALPLPHEAEFFAQMADADDPPDPRSRTPWYGERVRTTARAASRWGTGLACARGSMRRQMGKKKGPWVNPGPKRCRRQFPAQNGDHLHLSYA